VNNWHLKGKNQLENNGRINKQGKSKMKAKKTITIKVKNPKGKVEKLILVEAKESPGSLDLFRKMFGI